MLMMITSTTRFSKLIGLLCFLIVVFQMNSYAAEDTPQQTPVTLKVTNVTFKELLVFEESLRQRMAALEKLNREKFDASLVSKR